VISGGVASAYHVLLSLAVVIAIVVVAARLLRRSGIKGPGAGLRVLDRTGLSREASVAVLEVDGRRLVVGVTSHGVSLLTDLTEGPRTAPPLAPSAEAHAGAGADAGAGAGADTMALLADLVPAPRSEVAAQADAGQTSAGRPTQAAGSVLSPATWKQGVEALRELTARKG
jgi:flagellar protein FliO/FliZ